MAELPSHLPSLASAGKRVRWYLDHACDLWRWWLAEQPLAEQERRLGVLTDAERALLKKHGGVPEPTEPEEEEPEPELKDLVAAWQTIRPDEDVFGAFSAAMEPRDLDLYVFQNHLLGIETPSAEERQLLLDVQQRALASPSCRWPHTHWRPHLVDSLVALGDLDAARNELGWVTAGAVSYIDANWSAIVGYLDACGRHEDAAVMHYVASRYVVHFAQSNPRSGVVSSGDSARASHIVLELLEPVLADLGSVDLESMSNLAFLLEQLVEHQTADATVKAQAVALRALLTERKDQEFRSTIERLAAGEQSDETTLRNLMWNPPQQTSATEAHHLATAALKYENLIPTVGQLALTVKDSAPEAAKAVFLALLAITPPTGSDRESWLYSANNALIVTHAAGWFELSAQLADQVVVYVVENPYITHSAACSYVAVGRFDDAMTQVRLAVELGYDHLSKLRKDADLGPLLERPDFQALFD